MIPVFIALVLIEKPLTQYLALFVFLIAAVTDSLDGYVARKYELESDFGKFLDPLADKLLVTAALATLVNKDLISVWAMYIIVMREFTVTGLRLIAVSKGVVIGAGILGKLKTVVQIIVVSYALAPFHINLEIDIAGYKTLDILVFCMLVITIISGAEYFYKNIKLISTDK